MENCRRNPPRHRSWLASSVAGVLTALAGHLIAGGLGGDSATQPATSPASQPTGQPATSPATLPGNGPDLISAPEFDALLNDLSNPNWRIRDHAVDRLEVLGEKAVTKLRAYAQITPSGESRRGIELCLKRIAFNLSVGPTLVSIHLKDAKPEAAFDALARAGHMEIRPGRKSLWTDRDFAPLTLDLNDVPFWEAMNAICVRLNVQPMFQGGDREEPPQLVIVPDLNADMACAHTSCGSFMIAVATLARRPTFNQTAGTPINAELQLRIYADPKWRVTEYPKNITIETATAADGKPLPKAEPLVIQSFKNQSPIWIMRGMLGGVAPMAQRLGHIKGSFNVTLLGQSERAEVRDILHATNVVSRSSGQSLQVVSVTAQGEQYHVKVIITRNGLTPQEWRTQMEPEGISLLDEAGHALARQGFEPQENGTQTAYDLTFGSHGDNPGPPARLSWQIPMEAHEIAVPFDLSDLPIAE